MPFCTHCISWENFLIMNDFSEGLLTNPEMYRSLEAVGLVLAATPVRYGMGNSSLNSAPNNSNSGAPTILPLLISPIFFSSQ